MSKKIKLKKGLDIKLVGKAEKVTQTLSEKEFAIKPTDFIGLRYAKLLVAEGDKVKAGTKLCYDKYREDIFLTAPVSGTVTQLKRGAKRVLEEIRIESDNQFESLDFGAKNITSLNREAIKETLLESGVWAFIRQRPYSTVADPNTTPKSIFVSGFKSAPLATDQNFVVEGQEEAFQAGITVLSKLTDGKVHLNLSAKEEPSAVFKNVKDAEINYFDGPHPAGNVGIQIHHLDPINKGDIVWYTYPQMVIMIGKLFLTGKYDSKITIALTGSEVSTPQYYTAHVGSSIKNLVQGNVKQEHVRYISGDVLTGDKIAQDGYLSFYHDQVTVIPEGDYYEMFGWIKPGLNKFSTSSTFLSKWFKPNKQYALDTNFHGGPRALVVTGKYEKVIPMDIMPMQLIKATIIKDIDLMENLGIYEVDEEDFALAEFICTSKLDIQSIIREGLDLIRVEMS